MRHLVAAAAFLCAVLAAPASADYAPVNGLRMYYEIQGAGRPLVLLHGGLCTIEVCLGKIRQPFEKARRTIAIEKEWPALVAKIANMLPDAKGFSPEAVRAIKAPTLIMIGDSDIVRPEHAVQMFRLHQHAQLAVLPGASHFAPMERPDWIVSMTRAFFNAPMPEAKK